MARYFIFIFLFFFTFCFKSLTAASNSSFWFKNFGQDSNFDSVLELYGDSKIVNGVLVSTTGRLIYKNPIKFYSGIAKKLVSFSTYFSFSVSKNSTQNGDGLAFIVVSEDYPVDLFDKNGSFGLKSGDEFKFLSVEFDTLIDDKYGDMNGNHIGIDLSNFVSLKATNLSNFDLGLSNGNKLQVWIDYEAGSRRLEVRLSKFGEKRPLDPLLFKRIDLTKISPKSDNFFVGISSSNGNLYSWGFKTRESPDWMHSEPLDPIFFKEKGGNKIKLHKKNDCVVKILSALILGIGLGALGSFIGMFLWMIFANKRQIAPEEYAAKPVADKDSANGKQ